MGWSAAWPVARWSVPDNVDVFNNLVAALGEREVLVPSGYLSGQYDRFDPIRGQPTSGGPTGLKTVSSLQKAIEQALGLSNDWRWWDRSRTQLYTLANLLSDAFGSTQWTYDLTSPPNTWVPPWPEVFNELRLAINEMDTLRRLPSTATVEQVDSVFRLTFGITNWPQDRADTLALFDGVDDGAGTGLLCQVGLTAVLFDSGADQQWFIDNRLMEITFDTSDLDGYTVSQAWLQFDTQASPGSTDYSGTFTAEVVNAADDVRATFASDSYGYRSVVLPGSDINTSGDSVFRCRSQKPNTDDRPAWSPPGPNYQSTYREGFHLGDTLRLIVEVDFDYGA